VLHDRAWKGEAMSKGSKQRPVDQDKFNDNFDRIFGSKEIDKYCASCKKRFTTTKPESTKYCSKCLEL